MGEILHHWEAQSAVATGVIGYMRRCKISSIHSVSGHEAQIQLSEVHLRICYYHVELFQKDPYGAAHKLSLLVGF